MRRTGLGTSLHSVEKRTRGGRNAEGNVSDQQGQQLDPPTPLMALRMRRGGEAEGEPRDYERAAKGRRRTEQSEASGQTVVRPGEKPEIDPERYKRGANAKKRIPNPSVEGRGDHSVSSRGTSG